MMSIKAITKLPARPAILAAVLAIVAAGMIQARADTGSDGAGTNAAATTKSTIEITAVISKFTPSKVSVTVGVPTTLRFVSKEGVHGISSDDLGIPSTVMSPGKPVLVTFTAKKAGAYPLHCSVVCGANHGDMLLTVEAKGVLP